jgi:GDP-L-fucose synthase
MNHYESAEVINVGVGSDISIKALAEMIASIAGFRGDIHFDSFHPDGTMKKLLDDQQVKKLGWKSHVELQQGIQVTHDYYMQKSGEKE